MKLITKEWLDKAKEDLDVVSEIISRKHLTNMVAFHSQQAVEKTLKGIIEEFEIGFVETHNLERLLGMARKKMDFDHDVTIIKRLDEVYISTRYPADLGLLPSGKPTIKDAKELFEFADAFYRDVKRLLEQSMDNGDEINISKKDKELDR